MIGPYENVVCMLERGTGDIKGFGLDGVITCETSQGKKYRLIQVWEWIQCMKE